MILALLNIFEVYIMFYIEYHSMILVLNVFDANVLHILKGTDVFFSSILENGSFKVNKGSSDLYTYLFIYSLYHILYSSKFMYKFMIRIYLFMIPKLLNLKECNLNNFFLRKLSIFYSTYTFAASDCVLSIF